MTDRSPSTKRLPPHRRCISLLQRRPCLSWLVAKGWRAGIELRPLCADDFGSASYISSPP